MEFKTALLKEDTSTPGEFIGYASTWVRERDSYGDVVAKGAFKDTLTAWAEKDAPIPALWGHRMDDPSMFIGVVKEAEEDDHGLRVRVALDLDNPTAAQVHRLLKTKAVAQMSFAFDIREDATVTLDDGEKARELRRLDLYEVSVVPVGANQDTSIESVKARKADDDGDDGDDGGEFTADQVRALKALANDWLAEHNDDEDNPKAGGDSNAEAQEGKAEAVARLNTQIDALAGKEGE